MMSLFSLLICLSIITDCELNQEKPDNKVKENDMTPLHYLKTSLNFVNFLLGDVNKKLKVNLRIMAEYELPSSQPPDFIENYTINDVPQNATPDMITKPKVAQNWYPSPKPLTRFNMFTSYYLITPSLPKRPHYTIVPSTTTPTTESTDFWDKFFTAGRKISKSDLWTNSSEFQVFPGGGEYVKPCQYKYCATGSRNNAKKLLLRKHKSTQLLRYTSVMTKQTTPKIHIRSTANNYKRDFEMHRVDSKPHFQWNWGYIQEVTESDSEKR